MYRNYQNLVNKIGAATAVSKNREKIKHNMIGGCIDINNKQNKKIFECILDEAKVLKEKIKKYKELPKKYDKVKSKYKDIKQPHDFDKNPMQILHDLKPEDPLPYPFNQFKEKFEEKQKEKGILNSKRMTIDESNLPSEHRNSVLESIREKTTSASPRVTTRHKAPPINNMKKLNTSLEFKGYQDIKHDLADTNNFKVNFYFLLNLRKFPQKLHKI